MVLRFNEFDELVDNVILMSVHGWIRVEAGGKWEIGVESQFQEVFVCCEMADDLWV